MKQTTVRLFVLLHHSWLVHDIEVIAKLDEIDN
jgi:hypothetical protein